MRQRAMRALSIAAVGLAWVVLVAPVAAVVEVSGPDDPSAYFPLFMPTGEFDERGLSGFEFLISSQTGNFRENDLYLISGEETDETTSLGADLGTVDDLSGTPFGFSIQYNVMGGRNFTFRVTNQDTLETAALCWGMNCEPGSVSAEILNGIAPILDYNGLQIQARAQDVAFSSIDLVITSLDGVDLVGENFFDELVTPLSAGTIFFFDFGRRGQWMMGDDLDLVSNEWELTGVVTLSRPDAALSDVTKVRLAVDLVRDPNLAFVPEPSTQSLLLAAIPALIALGRLRGSRGPSRRRES